MSVITVVDESEYAEAYGGVAGFTAQYMNKAWYTTGSQWVYWITATPDTTGASYPGPGSFGDCTNYRVESIVYAEEA